MNLHTTCVRTVGFCAVFAALVQSAVAQTATEAATRQYAVAVGFQNQKLYEAAIDEWQTFIKKYPADGRMAHAQHYLGTCCLQAKDHLTAIKAFQTVIQKFPKFDLLDQTALNLGISYYAIAQESGKPADYGSAEKAFAVVISKFPKSEFAPRALFYSGECQYQQDKLTDAAESYSALIRSFPADDMSADALYALGVTQEALKQPDEALATFARFGSKYQKHRLSTEVHMRQAEILFTKNSYQQALALFSQVSTVDGFRLADVAMLRQARCLYELDQFDKAGNLYWNVPRQFEQTKHYDTAVLAGGKCFFLDGQYDVARTGLEIVAKRDVPEAAEAKMWIARSFLKEGDAAKALTTLDAAIAAHEDSPELPQLLLARVDAVYEIPDRRAESVGLYADFATKHPEHDQAAQAQYMAALAALDVENYAAARTHSDAFLVKFDGNNLAADVQFVGAEARLMLKDYAGASRQYERFLRIGRNHDNAPQARVRLGLALHLADKHEDAVEWLQASVSNIGDATLKSEALALIGRSQSELKKFREAAQSLEQSLAAQPDREQSDETLLALAEAYRQLDRQSDATRRLDQLIEQYPDSNLLDEAHFRVAEAAYGDGRFDVAIRNYTTVVTKWPRGTFASHAQYGLGWTHFNTEAFRDAIAAMTKLVENYKSSEVAPKGLYVRAMSQYQLAEFDEVVADVTAYLATNPEKVDALDAQYVLGLAHAGLERFGDAVKTYETILRTDRNYAGADKAAYELGWAYLELGEVQKSAAAFKKLAADYPDSPLAAESLFRVAETHYEDGDFDAAAKAYVATLGKAGISEIGEKAAHKLGWAHLKDDDYAAATTAFNRQVEDFPEGELAGDAVFLLGECQFKQDKFEASLPWYERVIAARNPNYHALALFRAGECCAGLKRWSDSGEFHRQVLKDFPEFELLPEARYGVGWALQNQGDFDAAMELYEKVTDETQTETAAKARFMIGECLFAQKKHAKASAQFLKAAFGYNHPEWSAMAYFEAARCFEVLKDVDQAKNCYQQLLEKYGKHPKAADARRRLAQLGS